DTGRALGLGEDADRAGGGGRIVVPRHLVGSTHEASIEVYGDGWACWAGGPFEVGGDALGLILGHCARRGPDANRPLRHAATHATLHPAGRQSSFELADGQSFGCVDPQTRQRQDATTPVAPV